MGWGGGRCRNKKRKNPGRVTDADVKLKLKLKLKAQWLGEWWKWWENDPPPTFSFDPTTTSDGRNYSTSTTRVAFPINTVYHDWLTSCSRTTEYGPRTTEYHTNTMPYQISTLPTTSKKHGIKFIWKKKKNWILILSHWLLLPSLRWMEVERSWYSFQDAEPDNSFIVSYCIRIRRIHIRIRISVFISVSEERRKVWWFVIHRVGYSQSYK